MALKPGETIHTIYRILARLRQSRSEALYLCYDVAQERAVQLRERRVPAQDRPALQRELERLMALSHPSLPLVVEGFASGDDTYCIVTEHLPGRNLEELARAQQPATPDRAASWAIQILEALVLLHQATPPIIHHRISLRTIHIHSFSERAYLLDPSALVSDIYTLPPPLGPYEPPEQYERHRTIPASDVYAVGICLYQLVTGAAPPTAMERLRGVALAPPTDSCPQLVGELEHVILQATDVEPARRYAHAAAMLEELRLAHAAQQRHDDPERTQRQTDQLQHDLSTARRQTDQLQRDLSTARRRLARARHLISAARASRHTQRNLIQQQQQQLQDALERRQQRPRVRRSMSAARPKRMGHRRQRREPPCRRIPGPVQADTPVLPAQPPEPQKPSDPSPLVQPTLPAELGLMLLWLSPTLSKQGMGLTAFGCIGLLLWPDSTLFASTLVGLFGTAPLWKAGLLAWESRRRIGWRWEASHSWLRLLGCTIYGFLQGVIILTLLGEAAVSPMLRWTLLTAELGLAFCVGLLLAGAPRHQTKP
jgi:serine/threonine protein kinase